MTNEELRNCIALLSEGDSTAFEKIYKNLNRPMYTIVLRIVKDQSVAEDILQEVFIKLYQSPPVSANNPRAYLFQTARNLAIDSVRKNPQLSDLEDCESMICSPMDDISQRLDIENGIRLLPTIECQIVSLHLNGELKFREIADIVNMPIGTVLWKYQKAIKRLRSYLQGGAL